MTHIFNSLNSIQFQNSANQISAKTIFCCLRSIFSANWESPSPNLADRSGQIRSGQFRSGQVRSSHVRSGQVKSGQVTNLLGTEDEQERKNQQHLVETEG